MTAPNPHPYVIPSGWTRDGVTRKLVVLSPVPPPMIDAPPIPHKIYVTVDINNGHPSAIRLIYGDQGSTVRGLLRIIGILSSMLLKRGATILDIAKVFRCHQFEPDGVAKVADKWEKSKSLMDAVGLWLERKYGGVE